MKVGDKLYHLIYWEGYDSRFQVYTQTITKINSKTIEVWACKWKVKKSEIGWKFFTSKKSMYKYYLDKFKESIKPTFHAIRLLENRLKKRRNNGRTR